MANLKLLVRRLLVTESAEDHAKSMSLPTSNFSAYRLHTAPDTEILHIPVSKYESALDLACCLEKTPEEISADDRALCQRFLDRRVKLAGYPKVAFAEKVTIFFQHYAPRQNWQMQRLKQRTCLFAAMQIDCRISPERNTFCGNREVP